MILGITGGIGSGKSTVAAMLVEHGAVLVDADAIARSLVTPGHPVLTEIVEAFGPGILAPDGSLNRGALAAVAFRDPSATATLNAIMHPKIAQEARRQIQASGAEVIVYDMPLLVETGQAELVDYVVVVDVPEAVQRERSVALRGLDTADVDRRMQVQATREQRRAVADTVIDNSGPLEATRAQVDALWAALRQ
jgi:dephospho-CoA kinase